MPENQEEIKLPITFLIRCLHHPGEHAEGHYNFKFPIVEEPPFYTALGRMRNDGELAAFVMAWLEDSDVMEDFIHTQKIQCPGKGNHELKFFLQFREPGQLQRVRKAYGMF